MEKNPTDPIQATHPIRLSSTLPDNNNLVYFQIDPHSLYLSS